MKKSLLAWLASLLGYFALAHADEVTQPDPPLETVLVTGSLIPQIRDQTAAPVTTITLDEMEARGFPGLADALQQTSFATGSVTNAQAPTAFTPGARTLSVFGLSPAYLKYLVDGRPMSNYPALYNSQDVIVNIAGIPEAFIDRVEIVPGGESSLYGSDAIAGIVNVILKKHLDGPVADFRYGFFDQGGGASKRLALADQFDLGNLNILAGVQLNRTDPIWGYQRAPTAKYYDAGTTPMTAERDYLVFGNFGNNGDPTYYFLDPAHCAHVAGQFAGSLGEQTRPGLGEYCGTTRAGFNTIGNSDRTVQGYLHANAALTDQADLFADVLVNHSDTRFHWGTPVWDSSYFYDPNLQDLIILQRIFSPEEVGGLASTFNEITTNEHNATVGLNGTLGDSHITYEADLTHAQEHLVRHNFVLFNDPIENYYSALLGPSSGPDPIFSAYPTLTPDYAAFYQPVPRNQFTQFAGFALSHSGTSYTLGRIQLTDASLLTLPAGAAASAFVLEFGHEEWRFDPDPRYLDGEVYGIPATTGAGHRSRYAITDEVRLPLLASITLNASGRYDAYHVSGRAVDKATYNVGLEWNPIRSVWLRGRYGTAFKAPTLADEFQGRSTFNGAVTDYYQCALLGYTGNSIGNCPYVGTPVSGSTSGSLSLKPITADVWDIGLTWNPFEASTISADLLHWSIANEVTIQSDDELLQREAQCRLGQLNIDSPTCLAALDQVTRDPTGVVTEISLPKVNVSREIATAFTLQLNHTLPMATLGRLQFQLSWSDLLRHNFQLYSGDPFVDELRDPTYSTELKSRMDASVTWTRAQWSGTLYVNRVGRSPNWIAADSGYGAPGSARLPPWTLCNFTLQYRWEFGLSAGLAIDNLFDRMPPADHSYPGTSSEPFNDENYNVYGRSYFLQLSYHGRH